MESMEARTLDGAAISEQKSSLHGSEHDALVAEADALLSVGKAHEAAEAVMALRLRFPESEQTRRVVERLRIASQANRFWNARGAGDFLTLFSQAGSGAFCVGGGLLLLIFSFPFAVTGLVLLLGGAFLDSLPRLALAALLIWPGYLLYRRGRTP